MIPRDPGRQPERTALAWYRTALSLMLFALLSLNIGLVRHNAAAVLAAFAAGGAAAAMFQFARSRSTYAENAPIEPIRAAALLAAFAVIVLAGLHAAGVILDLMAGAPTAL
jgi:uncharacterized membrane protein YidH (DUF202 family)